MSEKDLFPQGDRLTIEKADDPTFCTRCGEKIKRAVWLELDTDRNRYTNGHVLPEHSQGAFPFGVNCARTQLRSLPR